MITLGHFLLGCNGLGSGIAVRFPKILMVLVIVVVAVIVTVKIDCNCTVTVEDTTDVMLVRSVVSSVVASAVALRDLVSNMLGTNRYGTILASKSQ